MNILFLYLQVYEEKEKMWERELRKIKGLYDNRLRASQQKSSKMEQALTNQTYQVRKKQGGKKIIIDCTFTFVSTFSIGILQKFLFLFLRRCYAHFPTDFLSDSINGERRGGMMADLSSYLFSSPRVSLLLFSFPSNPPIHPLYLSPSISHRCQIPIYSD